MFLYKEIRHKSNSPKGGGGAHRRDLKDGDYEEQYHYTHGSRKHADDSLIYLVFKF